MMHDDEPTPMDQAVIAADKVRDRQKEARLEEMTIRRKKRQAAEAERAQQNQLNPQMPPKPVSPPKPV